MSGNKRWKREWTEAAIVKRKARRWKELRILDEGEAIVDGSAVRTITVARYDKVIELYHGPDLGRACRVGPTRLTDWTKAGAIPPAITLATERTRYFTRNQSELIRKLATRNDHCANGAQIAERHAVIQEIWQRWEE